MLPDFLVDHFEVVSANETQEILHLYFEEKAKAPKKFDTLELVSKGFVDEITIQYFPLRGKFARSRYILYKNKSKWTQNQTQSAKLLFELYPDIEKSYQLSQDLRNVFENTTDKIYGISKLARWYEKGIRLSLNHLIPYLDQYRIITKR
ncbi:ISAon1 family transposase N-terminal region protein [Flavobacterium hiemivividum]|uniref:ISAon1 family transposase N-terminal region protein n=1 Tax=Flavobacterium hiemivividum TaxID=2541734 RepID=UPI001A9DC738|nr:transposase [Flavobacterium hiemivividum]